MSRRDGDRRATVRPYLIGYAAALTLTAVAFAAVRWPSIGSDATLAVVLALGFVQAIVQFRCFLHVGLDRGSRDRLGLLIFAATIVALMVAGTLVILFNLRARMM